MLTITIAVKEACSALEGMLASLGQTHSFIPDSQRESRMPARCKAAVRITDAHLLALASAHDARLVTLDTGIPDAFVVPTSSLGDRLARRYDDYRRSNAARLCRLHCQRHL